MTIDPLFADVYAGDLNGHAHWYQLAAAGAPWHGGIIKATEGLDYAPNAWFKANWQAIRDAGSLAFIADPNGAPISVMRYGLDWWRACYHYARFNRPAVDQAQVFHSFVEKGGGWGVGDLWPIVDVESANNAGCTRSQVEDWVEAYVAESKRIHGREVILYGGSLLYDLGITSKMGCKALWIARYTGSLPAHVYERIGWTLDDVIGWQYVGTGAHDTIEGGTAGYPSTSPMGNVDITALVWPGGMERLRKTQWSEHP